MVSKSNITLGVIIPMYNEEKVSSKTVDEVLNILKNIKVSSRLIVIDDGSSDKTPNILRQKIKKYPKNLVVLTHKKNAGYGGATKTGIKYALDNNIEWCLHMDSDLTNPPRYIIKFVEKISKSVDCIKASRYINGSKVENVPLFRKAISFVGNFFAMFFFRVGIHDCTNGFRMVRTGMLKGIKFKENNFSIILEELYYLKKRDARFLEIPNVLYARTNTTSHFKYKPKIFYDYFKYAFKAAFT